MKIKYILLIIFIVNNIGLNAQKIYTTSEGHIMLASSINDKMVKAESHHLTLYLDYTTKEVKGVLDLKTLFTENDILNSAIKDSNQPLKLHFTGTIPIIDFMKKDHEPFSFNWIITITYQNKSFKAQLKSLIQHIEEGRAISCLLSARGEVDISNTGLQNILPDIDNILQIQFSQLLLRIE